MKNNEFPELNKILAHRAKTRKLVWISAISFWLGALMALKYYVVPTGTVPSLVPGLLMFGGAGLYFVVHYFIKYDLNN